MQETLVRFLGPGSGRCPRERDRLPIPVFLGFPCGSTGKEFACSEGDLGSIPGLGRSPGGGDRNSLQYSCLEDPHEQRSLEGYSVWGRKESDMTEHLSPAQYIIQQAKLIDIGGCYIPKNSPYW